MLIQKQIQEQIAKQEKLNPVKPKAKKKRGKKEATVDKDDAFLDEVLQV